jgi:acyl-CoA thioesterase I
MKNIMKLLCMFLLVIFVSSPMNSYAQALKVACVGNSITEGQNTIPFPLQLGSILGNGWNVQNYGVSGRTLLKNGDFPYWNEQKFKDALAFEPDYVIIDLGTNDSKPYNWDDHNSEFYNDYLALVDTFASLASNPVIYVCHPLKAFSGVYDIRDSVIYHGIIPLIDSVVAHRNVQLIDFYGLTSDKAKLYYDGVHPTSTGNNYLAEILFQVLTDSTVQAVPDQNVLVSKTVISANDNDTTKDNLNDGDYAKWWSYAGLPASLEVNLGTVQAVDFFQLAFSAIDVNKGYQYKIEGSLNGSDWNILVDQSDRNDTVSFISADSIATADVQYVRLTITSFSNSSSQILNIPEFKAYKHTGYIHSPLVHLKYMTGHSAGLTVYPRFTGDGAGYFSGNNDLGFGLLNYNDAPGKKLYQNVSGTANETNGFFTIQYTNGIKLISDTSLYTFVPKQTTITGIRQQEQNSFEVYPNPFTNEVNIILNATSTKEMSVKIFDLTGRLVKNLTVVNGNAVWDGTDSNLRPVSSGVYICSIENGQTQIMKKLLIRQ